jgi:hypothetical protein
MSVVCWAPSSKRDHSGKYAAGCQEFETDEDCEYTTKGQCEIAVHNANAPLTHFLNAQPDPLYEKLANTCDKSAFKFCHLTKATQKICRDENIFWHDEETNIRGGRCDELFQLSSVLQRDVARLDPRSRTSKNACALAGRRGLLGALQWMHEKGYQWDKETCASAAYGGHLAVLQWARANGCPWDEASCANAADYGHLDILQWARANGCPWDEETCANAAMYGHLTVLQWARANGCP